MGRSGKAGREPFHPRAEPARGAILYLRVSTARQLKGDVSIPSQRKAALAFCEHKGKSVVGEFVDGVSGTDDARPEFRRMIDLASQPDRTFDTIVVYSLSRFYRSGPESEVLIRTLRKKGLQVLSVTQPIGDDPSQMLLRQVIGILDEHSSIENSKNVRRAMTENARQGFWNGTPPPLGFRIVEAERRGLKVKKKLEIDPAEASIVRTIFDLYLNGSPATGPLGVKNTVKVLNERGYKTRKGARFGVGPTHNILSSKYYVTGEYLYGVTNSKTKEPNDPASIVPIAIPKLLDRDIFDRVQQKLAANNPRVTPPRTVNGPCLLAGIAVCASCGGGMTRTGTARGERRYSYYTCAGCHQKGETACKGRHIRSEKLDALVVGALKDRLFEPGRLATLLQTLVEQQACRSARDSEGILSLQTSYVEITDRLKRVYQAIENGVVEPDDILRDRIIALRAEQQNAKASLDRAKLQAGPAIVVNAENIARFGVLMRDRMENGDVNARRGYISSVVSKIEVDDDCVRIIGTKDTLRDAILGRDVSGFVRGWRTRHDSNV